MNRAQWSMIVLTALTVLSVRSTAMAELPAADHLRCYRVDAPREGRMQVDLKTRFGVDTGCVIKGAARELCEPAYDASEAATAAPSQTPPRERVCYRVECPKREMRDVQVSDRYGSRVISLQPPTTFCAEWP